MTPGSTTFVDLEVFKFAKDIFSFHWSKVGSRGQFHLSTALNVLSFLRISEDDLGYYCCDIKERGKVVLSVYRALYRDNSSACSVEKRMFTIVRDVPKLMVLKSLNYKYIYIIICTCISYAIHILMTCNEIFF